MQNIFNLDLWWSAGQGQGLISFLPKFLRQHCSCQEESGGEDKTRIGDWIYLNVDDGRGQGQQQDIIVFSLKEYCHLSKTACFADCCYLFCRIEIIVFTSWNRLVSFSTLGCSQGIVFVVFAFWWFQAAYILAVFMCYKWIFCMYDTYTYTLILQHLAFFWQVMCCNLSTLLLVRLTFGFVLVICVRFLCYVWLELQWMALWAKGLEF